jgi:hypothetical protein
MSFIYVFHIYFLFFLHLYLSSFATTFLFLMSRSSACWISGWTNVSYIWWTCHHCYHHRLDIDKTFCLTCHLRLSRKKKLTS